MTDGILLAETQGDRFLAATTRSSSTRRTSAASTSTSCSATSSGCCRSGRTSRSSSRRRRSTRSASPSTSTTRRSSRSRAAGIRSRCATAPAATRTTTRPRRRAGDPRRGRRAVGRAGPATCWCSSAASARSARPPRRCASIIRRTAEILPLYARLSHGRAAARVPAARARRRVVLATNVAETSLTVPGIRYVIDTGTARISRYSARLKVQRLPIEPISQASADQRTGRCGRVGTGICIRLYSEEDFARAARVHRARDPAHEPRRGDPADAGAAARRHRGRSRSSSRPTRRQVRDGDAAAAASSARSTERAASSPPLGRRLAQLPLDPRLGRMLLAADAERLRATRSIVSPRRSRCRTRASARPTSRRRPTRSTRGSRDEQLRLPRCSSSGSSSRAARRCRGSSCAAGARRTSSLPADPRVARRARPGARRWRRRLGVKLNPAAARATTPIHRALLAGPAVAGRRSATARSRVPGRARHALRDLTRLGAVQGAAGRGS